jgi:hypothetical protein
MKYKYLSIGHDNENFLWMPLVPTTMIGPKDRRKVMALVDSGATFSIAPIKYADRLGVVLDKTKPILTYGVTGADQSKPAYPANVTLQVEGLDPIEIPVYFMETDAFALILGQKGFFDIFRIKFEKAHGTFEITK